MELAVAMAWQASHVQLGDIALNLLLGVGGATNPSTKTTKKQKDENKHGIR